MIFEIVYGLKFLLTRSLFISSFIIGYKILNSTPYLLMKISSSLMMIENVFKLGLHMYLLYKNDYDLNFDYFILNRFYPKLKFIRESFNNDIFRAVMVIINIYYFKYVNLLTICRYIFLLPYAIIVKILDKQLNLFLSRYVYSKIINKLLLDSSYKYNPNDKCDTECLICLEEFENDEILVKIKCGHIFHWSCLVDWWKINPLVSCPKCRYANSDKIKQLNIEALYY